MSVALSTSRSRENRLDSLASQPPNPRATPRLALVPRDPSPTLSELHARFSGVVHRLVWRLLGADADHEDMVQQVFFAMLTSLGQLRDPSKIELWVRTVTVNAVRQELRRRAVRRLFWKGRQHDERTGDLSEEVESRDLLLQCLGVLEQLPKEQRLVFVLHLVEGHSLKDVAERCGYSHITAKRRLKAASTKFRILLRSRPDLLSRFDSKPLSAERADS